MPMGLGNGIIWPHDPAIVSLRTTGTRSLMAQLDLDHTMVVHVDMPENWHWLDASTNPWHVPLRDPVDHMIAIHINDRGKQNDYHLALRILCCWDKLISLVSTREAETALYRTDRLGAHEGKGEDHPARHDWNAAKDLAGVKLVTSWLRDRDRLDWFHHWYPSIKFEEQWLSK